MDRLTNSEAPQRSEIAARLVILSAATFATMIAFSFPQLADPLIRWDDYPAYFGDEAAFYHKTLTEGRWLNYLWISRPFLWPAWVNFLVYHAGWAIFSAGAAICFLGPKARTLHLFILSVLIALSPQAFLISAWFNTLIAAVWFLALYASLAALLPARTGLLLFLLFAPISMLLYSTFPFILISFWALRYDAPYSLARLVGAIVALGCGIALGMALMYGLNYLAHGAFDVVLAEDRTFLPKATTLEGAIGNAQFVIPLLALWLFQTIAFGVTWLGVVIFGLFFAALVVLARAEPIRALSVVALVASFVGVVLLHAVLEGIMVPMRSLIAVWIVMCATLLQAGVSLESFEKPMRMELVGIVLIAMLAGQFVKNTAFLMPWQAETRRIAEQVPQGIERLFVWGDYKRVEGAKRAHVLHNDALSKRLEMLTGADVIVCDDLCDVDPPSRAEPEDHYIETRNTDAFLVLVENPQP